MSFLTKWLQRFKANDSFDIGSKDLREFATDVKNLPSNERRGGPFFVIFLTHAEAVAAGRADSASLDQLDADQLCLGCLARVDLHPDQYGQWLILGYDSRPDPAAGLRTADDGNFSTRAMPAKWYKYGSQEAQQANVPLLDPLRNYPKDFQVREVYGGVSYQFFSRNGGAHPAPPDYLGDSNWGPATPPPPPPTALSDARPLSYAQYMLSRYPESIKPGLLYLLPGYWNSAPAPDTVEVEGGQGGFAALGTLVTGGTRLPVTVDVAAGTYSTDIGTGGGGGGGGGGYTDAQAQAAARQLLLAAATTGLEIDDDPQTGQLTITNTAPSLKDLVFDHPGPGTGNLLRRFFRLRYPVQQGTYSWVRDENISHVELTYAQGSGIFNGSIADFRAIHNSFLYTERYAIILTPIDVNQEVILELVQQV